MIYTHTQIRESVAPIAEKYALNAVYLFGSYARNDATEESDIDFLIDRTDSTIKGMFDMGSLYNDLASVFNKNIDIVTTSALEQPINKRRNKTFGNKLMQERTVVYER